MDGGEGAPPGLGSLACESARGREVTPGWECCGICCYKQGAMIGWGAEEARQHGV